MKKILNNYLKYPTNAINIKEWAIICTVKSVESQTSENQNQYLTLLQEIKNNIL